MIRLTIIASLIFSISGAFAFTPLMPSGQAGTSKYLHDVRGSTSSYLSMFTGIVEEIGTVVSLEQRDDMVLWDGTRGQGTELVVKGDIVLDEAYLG